MLNCHRMTPRTRVTSQLVVSVSRSLAVVRLTSTVVLCQPAQPLRRHAGSGVYLEDQTAILEPRTRQRTVPHTCRTSEGVRFHRSADIQLLNADHCFDDTIRIADATDHYLRHRDISFSSRLGAGRLLVLHVLIRVPERRQLSNVTNFLQRRRALRDSDRLHFIMTSRRR